MNLNKRTIKALEETLKYLKKKYEAGLKVHNWDSKNCFLCKEFRDERTTEECFYCPFDSLVISHHRYMELI